jgi:hypothetical protein
MRTSKGSGDGPHEFLASGREKTMATDNAEVTAHSFCFGA